MLPGTAIVDGGCCNAMLLCRHTAQCALAVNTVNAAAITGMSDVLLAPHARCDAELNSKIVPEQHT